MTECSVLARVDHASLWKQMMTLVPRSCSALAARQLGGRGSGSCLLTLIRSLDTNEVRFHYTIHTLSNMGSPDILIERMPLPSIFNLALDVCTWVHNPIITTISDMFRPEEEGT